MPETFLFLGGSLDGQRISVVHPNQPYIVRHPVETSVAAEWSNDPVDYRTTGHWEEVYHPAGVAGHSTRFQVFALQGWRGDDIIDRLVNGTTATRGERGGAVKLSNVQRVRVSPRWTDKESREVQARMVAAMAERAHLDGLKFDGWPKVEREELRYDDKELGGVRPVWPGEKPDLIEFRVSVIAVPR